MMHKDHVFPLVFLAILLLSACQPLVAPDRARTADAQTAALSLPDGGAIAEVNGVALYYEVHGEGEPLLFLPGDMRTTEDVADLTNLLATDYQVIVLDARGRGRSTDAVEPLTMAVQADDAVALLDELGIDKAHVLGWASSAAVGLEMAMRYPDRVDKLVAHGPNYTVDGLAPDHLAWFKSLTVEDMVPMFEEQYSRTAPDPAYLPVMLERVQDLILAEPNYTVEMLGDIQAPTLVIDGDLDDWIVREHLETLAATVPNGELMLLPELTHFAPFEDPVAWTGAVKAFLAQPAVSTDGTQVEPLIRPNPEQPVRILFIGDSHTSRNLGLEAHLVALAASADPPIKLETASIAHDGAPLQLIWYESDVAEQIRNGRWDTVVLQNAGASNADIYQASVAQYAEEIRKAGAQPVLFAHWDEFNDPQSRNSRRCAAELDIPMAEAGSAWANAIAQRPDLALVDPSDPYRHASVPGTYLNTAVLYATLFGRSPEGAAYRPVDLLPDLETVKPAFKLDMERMHEAWQISDEDAAFLQQIAWETVLEGAGGQ